MSEIPYYWIKWFKRFYEKINKNISISSVSENAAVLIEPRDHPMLIYVLYNFMYLLAPKGWCCYVFCSKKNIQTLLKIKEKMNIQLCLLHKDNLEEHEYNSLLTSPTFYEHFPIEVKRLLIFQTDTILLKDTIEDFFKFDFIGAAWSFSPHKGCNGGLSLRNRKKMLDICKLHTCTENEDGFFSYTHEDMLNLVPTLNDKVKFSMETIWSEDPLGMHRAYGHHQNEPAMMELLQKAWSRIFNTIEELYEPMITETKLLSEILELGVISCNAVEKALNIIPPNFTVHTHRIQPFLNFIVEYLNYHGISQNMYYYYTVYDGWRERSEPSKNPNFIFATKNNIEQCKGMGSWKEPGRFIQQYKYKDDFLCFQKMILSYGRHKNDPYVTLIPDHDFISSRGYSTLLHEIALSDIIPWEQKQDKIFWRGGMHGVGYKAYDTQNPPRCQRQMLCEYKSQGLDKPKWLDAMASYDTKKSEFLQYKYMIDIDGEVNSWSAFWWKLYSNSVVFKVNSHFEQWYYKELKEWVHYIPVKEDLSDLEEKYQWAMEHPEECKQINNNSTEFIKLHTYDYVLHNLKI